MIVQTFFCQFVTSDFEAFMTRSSSAKVAPVEKYHVISPYSSVEISLLTLDRHLIDAIAEDPGH